MHSVTSGRHTYPALARRSKPSSTGCGTAPLCRTTSRPPLNTMTVGIPRIWNSPAVRGERSVSSLPTSAPAIRGGQRIDRWRHLLTRATPVGVEIHEHRDLTRVDGPPERVVGKGHRPVEQHRPAALATLRPLVRAR